MAIINVPAQGPDFSTAFLESMFKEKQLQQQRDAMDLQERQVKLQEQAFQQKVEQGRIQDEVAQGLLPVLLQELSQAAPKAQVPTMQSINPAAASEALQGIQDFLAQNAQRGLADANAELAQARTEGVRADIEQNKKLFPLIKDLREAETELRQAQADNVGADLSLRREELEESKRQFDLQVRTQALRGARDELANLSRTSAQLGYNPAILARIFYGTPTVPTIDDLASNRLNTILGVAPTSASDEEFSSQMFDERFNRIVGSLGLSANDEAEYMDALQEAGNDPRKVLELAGEADLSDEAMGQIYLATRFLFPDAKLEFSQEDGPSWFMRMLSGARSWISQSEENFRSINESFMTNGGGG